MAAKRSVSTTSDGSYRLSGLAAGTYPVRAKKSGFTFDGPRTVTSWPQPTAQYGQTLCTCCIRATRMPRASAWTARRSPLSPNIPPLPGWYALVGPAKMDPRIVQKIHAAVERFVTEPPITAKLRDQYLFPLRGSGADIQKRGEVEAGLWGGLIRDLKIEAD